MAEVRFENVTKIVGGKKFADSVSFDIRDREFVSILGEPGSGKSMVLRMIAGLERPDSGNIYIGDRNVNDLRPAERNVAMVFQSFALYPHKTVYENHCDVSLSRTQIIDIPVSDIDVTAVWSFQSCNHPQHHRLPRPGLSQNGDEFSIPYIEANIVRKLLTSDNLRYIFESDFSHVTNSTRSDY